MNRSYAWNHLALAALERLQKSIIFYLFEECALRIGARFLQGGYIINSFLYLADFWSSLFVHRVHRLRGSNSGFPRDPRLIFERRRPLYIQFRGPSEFMVEFYKNQNFPKIDFGSLFEARWGQFQLNLIETRSSALERPCVRLSFPSLGGFGDPNLTSWRSFAVRLRFFREFHPRAISGFFAVFIFFLDGIVRIVFFSLNTRVDWTVCGWNSKGSSQLLDLPFQFLIQRSTLLFKDPPCRNPPKTSWGKID